MTSNQRIHAFVSLRSHLLEETNSFNDLIQSAQFRNPWFTPENVERALQANLDLLNNKDLVEWVEPYYNDFQKDCSKTVGLILAGNIPMVGFHDILSCLIAGFNVQIKTSNDDKILIPFILEKLIEIEPAF